MTNPPSPQGPWSKHRTGASILFGIAVAFSAVAAVGGAAAGQATADRPLSPPTNETVRYQVSGSPGAAEYITYEVDYHQQYEPNVPLPWTKQFRSPVGLVYVLSAQGPGSITCTISINGTVVSNTTATGTPARASCSH
ncbi:MAG TPA: MmpS family transport accessory protein [Mycobacterium sp.]|uniref:MmpS family transport accessory protein n=1 Tax=Mycobacterium sp. TaxID=1785 RepID=UPI002D3D554B|nr:MmpS family transport accessory protein [Mycobacterium sp.]HZU48410.1 MmpS family transport accessory protein [Mycobacterium sp.]